MWSVNIQHFLDDKGSTANLTPEARVLAEHFCEIVVVVTSDFSGRFIHIDSVECCNPKLKKCPGTITAVLGEELETIDWHCSCCDDSGVISGWAGTLWDCSENALADL